MGEEVKDVFSDLNEMTFLNESKDFRIDTERMIVHNVKLLGRSSKNGRDYSDKALNSYKRLAEGKNIYIDHELDKRKGRKVEKFGGNSRNIRVEEDGAYGDWYYHGGVAKLVEGIVAAKMDGVGMSTSGGGRTSKGHNGRKVVEDYTVHSSTDFVCNPATTKSLSEQTVANEAEAIEAESKELDKDVKDKETKLNEEVKKLLADLNGQVAKLTESLAAEKVAREKAEADLAKTKMINEAIEASGKTVTKNVRNVLELLESKEDVEALLADISLTEEKKTNPPASTGASDPLSESKADDKKKTTKVSALMEEAFRNTNTVDLGGDYKLQGVRR